MTREPHPPYRESGLTKVLAILLLVVAGALVFMVYQQRQRKQEYVDYDPKPIAQRPDDKLGADEQTTIDVFEKFSRSVVHVTSLAQRRNLMTLDVTEIPRGTGSGFVWDPQGHIVTNAHVVEGGDRASVTLNDGSTYAARIIGRAPDKDLAVLKIDAPSQKLLPLPIGQSATLKVGMKVLAIGNPFGLDQTLTTGVISGLGREIKSMTGRPITDMIQTDASINPGNSGGPLLDSSGRLIGVNTAIYSPTGASAGIGFAVPVDTVNAIVPQLLKHGRIVRPGLGINPLSDALADRYGLDGVVVIDVAPGSAAERAGIRGAASDAGQHRIVDVIVGVDNVVIRRLVDLYKVMDHHKVGDVVDVIVEDKLAGGKRRTVKVTLQAVQ